MDKASSFLIVPEKFKDCYAVTVEDDSMDFYNKSQNFPKGTILFVDPTKEVIEGKFIVAVVNENILFRRYVKDAGEFMLQPQNPSYRSIPLSKDDYILGVVVNKITSEEV